MYQHLYEYLILHKQLNVPGIGTFLVERKPAETEFTHKQINPSAYSIILQQGNAAPSKRFFNWLSGQLNLSYHEAIVQFNGFAIDLKNHVLSGNKIIWDDIGMLSKGMAGEIRFESALKDYRFESRVSAIRVIREKAVHSVRVGEEEKTSAEMSEWLNPAEVGKSYWWAPALIVAILLIIVAGIYFSQMGWKPSSAANQQKLSPQQGKVNYRTLP